MTKLLAFWGAIISSLLLGIEIMRFYYEGVNIKVEIKHDLIMHPSAAPYYDNPQIVVAVSNRGRRTTTITHAWLLTGSKKCLVFPECFKGSKKLQEGDYTQYIVAEESVNKTYGLKSRDHVAIVSDAVGRKFYSHSFLVRLFKIVRMRLFTKRSTNGKS